MRTEEILSKIAILENDLNSLSKIERIIKMLYEEALGFLNSNPENMKFKDLSAEEVYDLAFNFPDRNNPNRKEILYFVNNVQMCATMITSVYTGIEDIFKKTLSLTGETLGSSKDACQGTFMFG